MFLDIAVNIQQVISDEWCAVSSGQNNISSLIYNHRSVQS